MGDLSLGEALALSNDGNRNNGAWGEGGGWWMWIFLILIFFCWGGFGGRGAWGGNGNGGGTDGAGFQGYATRTAVAEEFALNGINNGISGLRDGQFGLQNTLCQGFNGINQSVGALGNQMQDCCCQTQRLIERTACDNMGAVKDLAYNMATGFNSAIQNAHNDTDRVLAKLDQMESLRQQERIQALQSENQTLRFQASQNAQNSFIDAVGNSVVAQLRQPTPVPAYAVPAPYPYAGNCGCGATTCC